MASFDKILIIKPGAIGDLLQITPVIRAIRRMMPDARITMLVANRASTDLFRYNADVEDCIVFDKRGEHRSLPGFWKLWRRIRAGRFDLVMNFQRSNLKAWLLVAAAVPCKVLVYHKARNREVHAVVNHLETLAPLGIGADDTALEFYPGPEAEQYAEKLFLDNGLTGRTVIALNPGASHPVNRWETNSFAELADLLAGRLDAGVILVGGREDSALAEEISAQTRCRPLVLTGKTDLLQLGAVLHRCSLLVSGDTGPMHMATAVNTRVVALFGAADPARTGPVGSGHRVVRAAGLSCVPCRSRECADPVYRECMVRITPEQVYDVIADMLAGGEHS